VAVAALVALPATAGAADPVKVASTLEGCKITATITLPNSSGDFICPTGAYTSGNLGKFWNELDLVPFRITLDASSTAPASQTYTLTAVLDNQDDGTPGFDVISSPTLNTMLSSAACTAASDTGQLTTTGFGGTDMSIYRKFTVTQTAGTTCIYDYYGRVALGAHLYSGSALHANLANENLGTAGIGASDVSIPVMEVEAQELSKDMSALQDSDHAWSISKGAQPDHVNFPNTCATGAALNAGVAVTVTWTKLPATAAGLISVVTHVYAHNPAARTITVHPTDVIKSGTTELSTQVGNAVDVPANTTTLVLTHMMTVPSGTTGLNDIATATYSDPVTQFPIPGTTQATASATVQGSGVTTNDSAVIGDSESIGGPFQYSADAFSPNIGSFQNGYVAGTPTSGTTDWLSSSQSASGSVTFSKTVYTSIGSSGSGSLSDTATLTGSNGFTTDADASVDLVSARAATITITKHIPNVLSGNETVSFTFDIVDADDNVVETRTLTFTAGQTTKSVDVGSLTPGAYTVSERTTTGWAAQDPVPVDVTTACSGGAEFTNAFGPATATATKITQPAGSESGWTMTLTGPGIPAAGEAVVTNTAGSAPFNAVLQEGTYTITETNRTGWTAVGATTCSFTVNYPADADRAFSCTFTNRRPAHAAAIKITQPAGSELGWTVTLSGPGAGANGESHQTDANGNVAFTTDLQGGGSYTLTETNKTGWDPNGTSGDCSFTVAYPADAGRTFTCTFTNRQRGQVKVSKTVRGSSDLGGRTFTFQLRSGASPTAVGTTLETQIVSAANNPATFTTALVAGATYQLCEILPGAGWMTSLFPGFTPNSQNDPLADNSVICHDFTVAAGELKTIAVDNTPPPGGLALTIGYWKNHASCASSNGKQKQALDTVLASFPIASGQTTHGVYIGSLYVDTCQEAVNLLNKSTVANKPQKMASDPAYNLAAQLMAVELNLQSGAGVCSALLTYRSQAQALLSKYAFNGTSSYTSGASKMSAADQTTANFLASKLDAWNNNRLC
jgi:hypothetical protein